MGSCASSLNNEAHALPTAKNACIKYFHSSEGLMFHLNDLKLKDSDVLMVIDFFTYWCGPVKLDHTLMCDMAHQLRDVEFIRHQLPELAKEFQVRTLSTFVLWKKGKEVDRVVGPSQDLLRNKNQKHRALQP